MHICLVTCAFAPIHGGGVAVSLSFLAQEFIHAGHQVSVFTIDSNKSKKEGHIIERKSDGVTCYIYNSVGVNTDFFDRYKRKDYYNRKIEKSFRHISEENDFDAYHFHALQGMGANLLNIPVELGAKSFVTFHDFWWVCPNLFYTDHNYDDCSKDCQNCHKQLADISKDYITKEIFYRDRREYLLKQLKKTDRIFSNSKYLISEIEYWGLKKVVLNENGIDLPPKNIVSNTKDEIVIGFVGGESELKGFSIVINALTYVENNDLRVHIHGTHKVTIRNLASDFKKGWRVNKLSEVPAKIFSTLRSTPLAKVDERIKMFGPYGPKKKYKIFNSFDAVIVGTRVKESFSLVTREALMLNIPVISSDCGGPLDVVREGKNGYVYDRNSPQSLAQAINRFLDDRSNNKVYEFNSNRIITIKQQAVELLQHYSQ